MQKTKAKKGVNSMQGFTIIEVVLVLAIAGLIFLMVFVALPSMQRSQRDTQRRNDLSRFYTALQNYMNNNKGALPAVVNGGYVTGSETSDDVAGSSDKWVAFYKNYMLASGDTFVDPDGTAYGIYVTTCANSGTAAAPNTGKSAGDACDGKIKVAEASGAELGLSAGQYSGSIDFTTQKGTIAVVIGASCNGETAQAATTKTGGTRKFAVMYKMEAGGVFCQSN